MHLKKYLSIFLIGIAFAVAGCSGDSNSGVNKEPIDDIDGDGIADIVDPDMDGDGIPNEQDPDDDNDGVEDSIDPTPPVKPGTKTCTAAQILPPEGGPGKHQLGDIGELGWKLLPEGCVLPLARNAGQGVPVSATKDDDGKVSPATAIKGNCIGRTPEQVQCGVDIQIPQGCGKQKAMADVTFDITEIGLALGDTTLSKGVYKQTNGYEMPKCDGGGGEETEESNFTVGNGTGNAVGSSCFSASGGGLRCEAGTRDCGTTPLTWFYVSTGDGAGKKVCELSAPSWTMDSDGFMNVALEGSETCTDKWNIIQPGSKNIGTTWEWLQENCSDATVKTILDTGFCNAVPRAAFVLKIEEENPTIRSFSAGEPANSSSCGSEPESQPPFIDDIDGDGIPNDSDIDVDGDGIPNTSDKDIDGDGIPNKDDPDIDGDGQPNGVDPDADGDGTPDAQDDTPGGSQ